MGFWVKGHVNNLLHFISSNSQTGGIWNMHAQQKILTFPLLSDGGMGKRGNIFDTFICACISCFQEVDNQKCPRFILGYKWLAPARQLKNIRIEIQDLELDTSSHLLCCS